MKTKTFNHFRNLFAFIGFFIIACSAAVELDSVDETPDDNPPIVQSNIGKYQIDVYDGEQRLDGNLVTMFVLNTETGQVKEWVQQNQNTEWKLYRTINTQ